MTAYEAQRYVLEHWPELVRDYPGEWVGFVGGKVVAHSRSFALLTSEGNYDLVEHIPSEAYQRYEDATDWKTRAETAERQLAEAVQHLEACYNGWAHGVDTSGPMHAALLWLAQRTRNEQKDGGQ